VEGIILYAFNHYKEKPMYFLKREKKDYGSAFLISTQKLSSESWKKIRPDRLLMVCNGEALEFSDPILK
jgi:predicted glutamine amidotransferase